MTKLILLAGCAVFIAVGAAAPAAGAADKLKVVATFSILGDLAREVGGDRVEVSTLVGPEGDAHVYAPSPADAKSLRAAKLVVVNGLGFEGWLGRLVRASGTKAAVVTASAGVAPLAGENDGDHARAATDAADHGRSDPHAWQSVANAKTYVGNIRDALAAADPVNASAYAANAEAYLSKLDALETEIRDIVGGLAPDRRMIITSHDAFAYFGKAYGLTFVAPQGVSTESEASARDVARIITQIRRQGISAVFIENISDARLSERIASETGARLGGRVYSDALSAPDGPAATYVSMMRHNVRAFATALTGGS